MFRLLIYIVAICTCSTLFGQVAVYKPIEVFEKLGITPDADGGTILDFSRVGYRYGDKEIPNVPVVKTIKAPKRGADATALIQQAIDEVAALPYHKRGAILLKAGVYNVSGTININESGIVLRGEGSNPKRGTHIHSTRTDNGYKSQSKLISFKGGGNCTFRLPAEMNIIEDVPVGQFWVRVSNPDAFVVGDEVVVHAETTMALISDLRMNQITPRKDGALRQWNERTINRKNMERVITKVSGDTLWFENPISMSLLSKYNRGSVVHYTYTNRIEECGIENMLLTCAYASDTDENHCWMAIGVDIAEHCWIRNIEARYFGMGLIYLFPRAKNVTVSDCKMLDLKSVITGARRYSFCNTGQLSIVKDCYTTEGRHSFASNGSGANGPNVFLRCVSERSHADIGPHHRWASGTLYDNIVTDGTINIQDRDNFGTGHGWSGVNEVLWNCRCAKVAVQSPWVCGRNYSIGTIGNKYEGRRKGRPDGVWVSQGEHVAPQSLYEAQLANRRKLQPGGVFDVK